MGIGTWTRVAPLHHPRQNASVSAANGKVYVMGGVQNTSTDYIEEYDPVTNTWTDVYTLSETFTNMGSGVIGNKIYIVGGFTYSSGVGDVISSALRVYDTVAKSWTHKADLPGPARGQMSCGVIDGKLYVIGGFAFSAGVVSNDVYVYDPATNSWTIKTPIPIANAYALACVSLNNKLYILSSNEEPKKLYEYDSVNDIWSLKSSNASLGLPGYYFTGVALKDKLYFFTNNKSVFEYNPIDDLWRSKASYLDSLSILGQNAVVLNDIVYLTSRLNSGGSSVDVDASSDIDDYTPFIPAVNYPTNGSTVATDTPILQATVLSPWLTTVKIEYQLSLTADFSTDIKSYIEPNISFRSTGLASLQIPANNKLSQQLWYIRARAVATDGTNGNWSTVSSFTIIHKPSAITLRPTAGNGILFTAPKLSWQFSDSSETDTQSAYQVILERNDDGTLIVDTGKITSISQFYSLVLDSSLKNVILRWKLQVWDQEDKSAGLTSYNLFQAVDAPTVHILSPIEGSTITNGSPEVSWDFSVPGSRTQASYSVAFFKQGEPTPSYTTGILSGSNNSNKSSVSILSTGTTYDLVVTVTDNLNVSATDTITFLAQFIQPDPVLFTVNNSVYESDGYVFLSWQAVSDAEFLMWRVYRRVVGENSYTVIGEISEVNVTQFKDWQVPSMNVYEYLVVQVVSRFGQQVESSAMTGSVQIAVDTGGYWLIDPVDSQNNIRLELVKEETYKRAKEQAELVVIGRGRHVDEGQRVGVSGTLTAQLRDSAIATARNKKHAFETLDTMGKPVYLRNPFGDIWYVSLGETDVSRIAGVGSSEFCDLTVPYSEVF